LKPKFFFYSTAASTAAVSLCWSRNPGEKVSMGQKLATKDEGVLV
jgi:hypothetical protein